ncbi:MAG: leucine--tRNA ligase [Pantoea sp. Brub]|nr:leucine--tRNA ligase [Pantoea sp. Brub]
MKENYCPKDIESRIQEFWEKEKTFNVIENINKEKYFCLSMLPYPSGKLHMGHVRNYTIGDVISRYQRMLGKNVLQPIGWDAFGLPAENAAIKNKNIPASWTYKNINYMKNQLKLLGFSYDWNRELTTCKPEYYLWEQWFFIQLYKNNLVYKKNSPVNWCPKDQTVLANEQVIKGLCWRCDTKVQQKNISQWFLKITKYAEELLNDLDTLEHWPEKVKTMQRNWIGRSDGMEITFKTTITNDNIVVFTTRPDTLMGVTYLNIAYDHPLSIKYSKTNPILAKFIAECNTIKLCESDRTQLEKKGVDTKVFVKHPLNHNILPVWVSNFVLIDYGTGAIMSVPAHDQRDWEFAIKYNLPMKSVILDPNGNKPDISQSAMNKTGILFNSDKFDGLSYQDGYKTISQEIINKKAGVHKVNYRLRDWCISRQRYWGVPIPMLTLENGDIIPVSEDQLPLILPEDVILDTINPIKINSEWYKVYVNNQSALRDSDTFDTFMESSWYYARYTCPHYTKGMLDPKAANYWLPVDQYIGGVEHAIMHLMYFRFYHKIMRDMGLVSCNEPATRLLCQGMVLSETFYYIDNQGEIHWVSPLDVTVKKDNNGKIVQSFDKYGRKVIYSGMHKMSKSKNNGIDPKTMIDLYGADTLRLFIMFAAPVEMTLQWKESGIIGVNRFLKRLWKLVFNHIQKGKISKLILSKMNNKQKILYNDLNNTIIKVSDDIDRRQTFNTAIAAIMEFINKLIYAPQINVQDRALMHKSLLTIILLLYPFTPHICYILWQELGNNSSIDNASWPVPDKRILIKNKSLIIVQINGKLRRKIYVKSDTTKEQMISIVTTDHIISKYLNNVTIEKIFYLPGKLLNLVIKQG